MRNYGKAVLQTKLSSKHHRQVWDPLSADAVLGDSGAPLASGYFAVIWIVKGDLDFFAKGFNLAHYNSNSPCPFCPCEIGGQKKIGRATSQRQLLGNLECFRQLPGELPKQTSMRCLLNSIFCHNITSKLMNYTSFIWASYNGCWAVACGTWCTWCCPGARLPTWRTFG